MLPGKKLYMVIMYLFILLGLTGSAQAEKSVYVINDTLTSRIQAYKIEGTGLVWQKDYICQSAPGGGVGSVGLTIDSSEYGQFLFVTFEESGEIELVNAKTMVSEENPVTVPGASSLAGIAFDKSKQKLYKITDIFFN